MVRTADGFDRKGDRDEEEHDAWEILGRDAVP
jgi:hypothetical protein